MGAVKAKGLEVCVLTGPVDEMWVDAVSDFDGKTFQSIAKGEVDLDTEDEKKAAEAEREEKEKEFGALLTWLTETLSDDIKETRLSTRLTTSAACIVGDAFSMSPTLEKMSKADRKSTRLNSSH